jgi:glycosyltransferase involved in cell wall biosynthesis
LIKNEEIIKFYQNNSVNLFISLSEAEGIPVSIMEAISFGIPILSTDVGGCKEIVAEETGILIPLETEMNEVANIITEFKDSFKNTNEFRKGVRKFWEEHFDAEKNYKSLFKQIENETN